MKPHVLFADLNECRAQGHKFEMTGSDKRPLQRNLLCVTCTLANHRNTYVAFGEEHLSFGMWIDSRKESKE